MNRIPLNFGHGTPEDHENVLIQQTLVHLTETDKEDPAEAIETLLAEVRPSRVAAFLGELKQLGRQIEDARLKAALAREFGEEATPQADDT